jgi:hypothetical protein
MSLLGGAERERGGVRERDEEAEEEEAAEEEEEEEEPVQHTYTHCRGEEEEERDTARLQCRRQRAGVCVSVKGRRHKTSNTYLFLPSSWPTKRTLSGASCAAFFLSSPGCGCLPVQNEFLACLTCLKLGFGQKTSYSNRKTTPLSCGLIYY